MFTANLLRTALAGTAIAVGSILMGGCVTYGDEGYGYDQPYYGGYGGYWHNRGGFDHDQFRDFSHERHEEHEEHEFHR